MVFYTKTGEKIIYNPNEKDLINSGKQGSVYHFPSSDDDKKCIKLYYQEDRKPKSIFEDCNTIFSTEMFSLFKDELNDQSLCRLYELLYNKDLTEVTAYIQEYLENIKDNILFMPKDYLLDSFNSLYNLVEKLTKNNILIVDLHEGNIILTSDGMKIIDYDKYRKVNFDYITLFNLNLQSLLIALRKLLIASTTKIKLDEEISKNKIKMLLLDETKPSVLSRRLEKYRTPIEMIYRR